MFLSCRFINYQPSFVSSYELHIHRLVIGSSGETLYDVLLCRSIHCHLLLLKQRMQAREYCTREIP